MKEVQFPESRSIVIVHGAPGAGKGTMSDRFASEYPRARHISSGDTIRSILRGHIDSQHTDAMEVLAAQGVLMPGEMSSDVMFEAIARNQSGSLYLFDGFPQRKSELDALLLRANEEKIRILGAICLEVDADVSVRRMEKRGLRGGEDLAGYADEPSYYRQRYERFMEYYETIKAQIANNMEVFELDANRKTPIVYNAFRETIRQATMESSART